MSHLPWTPYRAGFADPASADELFGEADRSWKVGLQSMRSFSESHNACQEKRHCPAFAAQSILLSVYVASLETMPSPLLDTYFC